MKKKSISKTVVEKLKKYLRRQSKWERKRIGVDREEL